MATQNSNNNDVNVSSLFPINITTVDDITLSSSNLIDIAGTNGTTIQDNTSITLTTDGTVNIAGPSGNVLSNTTGDIQLFTTGSGFIQIHSAGGLGIESTANGPGSIEIQVSSDTAATFIITNSTGTGDDSVDITSTSGGITLQSGTDTTISAAGVITLSTTSDATPSINIVANGGPDETINIGSVQGTNYNSVNIYSDAGGVALIAHGSPGLDLASDFNIGLNAGSGFVNLTYGLQSEGFRIFNAVGSETTSILVGTGSPQGVLTPANTGSLYIDVSGGGVANLYTNSDGTNTGWLLIPAIGGSSSPVVIETTSNTNPAITIEANGGSSETIAIRAAQGTGSDSVGITSTNGGITIDAHGAPGIDLASDFNIGINAANGFVDVLYGTESEGLRIYNNTAAQTASILVGTGTPQGVLAPANPGSLYIDVNGGGTNNLYTNSDGTNTGWYNIVGTKDPGGAGFTWQVNSSAAAGPFTLVPNNGYFANDSTTTIQYNLPLTANVGDTYSVFSVTGVALSPTWSINQNAGQTIQYQSLYATTGVGHGIQTFNNSNGVGLTLVCTAANTDWIITSTQGTSFALF